MCPSFCMYMVSRWLQTQYWWIEELLNGYWNLFLQSVKGDCLCFLFWNKSSRRVSMEALWPGDWRLWHFGLLPDVNGTENPQLSSMASTERPPLDNEGRLPLPFRQRSVNPWHAISSLMVTASYLFLFYKNTKHIPHHVHRLYFSPTSINTSPACYGQHISYTEPENLHFHVECWVMSTVDKYRDK